MIGPGSPDAISPSRLKLFREDVGSYYRRYVAKTEVAPPPTKQMIVGTATHLAVLQPAKFQQRVVEIPSWAKQRRGKLWEAFVAETPQKLRLYQGELAAIDAMAKAAQAVAGSWLRAMRHVEQMFDGRDERSGLPLKGILDGVCLCSDQRPLGFDLKTSGNLDGFGRSYRSYGYDLQEAHYRQLLRQRFMAEPHFRFIVVESRPPYRAALLRTSKIELDRALRQWRNNMDELAQCYETGVWARRESACRGESYERDEW